MLELGAQLVYRVPISKALKGHFGGASAADAALVQRMQSLMIKPRAVTKAVAILSARTQQARQGAVQFSHPPTPRRLSIHKGCDSTRSTSTANFVARIIPSKLISWYSQGNQVKARSYIAPLFIRVISLVRDDLVQQPQPLSSDEEKGAAGY